jgi:hypothetical protein
MYYLRQKKDLSIEQRVLHNKKAVPMPLNQRLICSKNINAAR